MSHIAILGATGRAGGRLLDEALRRGHTVTAIARHASAKLAGRANVKTVDVDALDAAALERPWPAMTPCSAPRTSPPCRPRPSSSR